MGIANKKKLIQSIVNVSETSLPEGKYDKLVIYDDGVKLPINTNGVNVS